MSFPELSARRTRARATPRAYRSEKTDHFHVTSAARASCELRARLMPNEVLRWPRAAAQRAIRTPLGLRRRELGGGVRNCSPVTSGGLDLAFLKKITGFVTSRSEPRPKLPQHGYHSIVAPWLVLQNGEERPSPSLLRFPSLVPLRVGFCACAWGVMSFGVVTPMTPRATRPRVTSPLTIRQLASLHYVLS